MRRNEQMTAALLVAALAAFGCSKKQNVTDPDSVATHRASDPCFDDKRYDRRQRTQHGGDEGRWPGVVRRCRSGIPGWEFQRSNEAIRTVHGRKTRQRLGAFHARAIRVEVR